MTYIAQCPTCPSELSVESMGDTIEHNSDGSHTFRPDPVRSSPDSGTST